MVTTQFISLNLYFAINLLAALVCFAVFWLIFDAWTNRRSGSETLKWVGFLVLSVGFLLRAASLRTASGDFVAVATALANGLRILGYLGIAIGQFLEPLQARPKISSEFDLADAPMSPEPSPESPSPLPEKPTALTSAKKTKHHHSFWLAPLTGFTLSVLAATISVLYFRRATIGLERHLKPVGYSFAGFTLFELLNNATSISTTNPTLYRLVAVYGPLWWIAQGLLLVSACLLGAWVWQYLVKRLQSQLFMLLITQTLIVFLCSTVGFTFLLLRNAQTQSLTDLATSSHVLGYAVSSLQAEIAAQAEAVAANPSVAQALATRDRTTLTGALANYLPQHNLTTLTVTDVSAEVLLRGEDPNRWGDSLSSNALVRRALVGENSTSVSVASGVIAPTVTLTAARPIRDSAGDIIGTVTAGRAITGSFVDGIRVATGLDSSVYGGNIRAATTLTGSDGTRAIGIKETSTAVISQVLHHGRSFAGAASFQNRSYLAAYAPLRDVNNTTVGMLLVARPADALFAAANRSIQLTFLFVIGLIIISVYPIYMIARFLTQQLK